MRQSKAVQSLITIHFLCKLLKQTKGLLLLSVWHRALGQDKIFRRHLTRAMITVVFLQTSVPCMALSILRRHFMRLLLRHTLNL